MANSTISYQWRDKKASQGFRCGVSLHSHTNQSHESLEFVANFGSQYPVMRPLLSRLERHSERYLGVRVNYAASYWTPPMTPKLAFDLERRQVEKLDLEPMVSITDHDTIQAPMLLRTVPSARHIPVSLEWSAPFGEQSFHLGVHNLPSAHATEWMKTLADYTATPSDARLTEILKALDEEPNVLVVFNHPMWDLYMIGKEKHRFLVNAFLQKNSTFLHAMELNGLRSWDENRQARRLAEKWNMLLISGGDRHGVEPNANINLTNATSFTAFVHEVRREKKSHVLFMRQYAEPWKLRLPALPGVSARLAHLGRARLPSGRERGGAAAERAVARRDAAEGDPMGARHDAVDGLGPGFRRAAHGAKRVARTAHGHGRARRLRVVSGVSCLDGVGKPLILDSVQKICIVLTHPSDKNKGVARVGHPGVVVFHPFHKEHEMNGHPNSVARHKGRINKSMS
jgi:hypothetical protein